MQFAQIARKSRYFAFMERIYSNDEKKITVCWIRKIAISANITNITAASFRYTVSTQILLVSMRSGPTPRGRSPSPWVGSCCRRRTRPGCLLPTPWSWSPAGGSCCPRCARPLRSVDTKKKTQQRRCYSKYRVVDILLRRAYMCCKRETSICIIGVRFNHVLLCFYKHALHKYYKSGFCLVTFKSLLCLHNYHITSRDVLD